MLLQLKKIGNSRGFTIPSHVLEKLGWDEKTKIQLEVSSSAIHLSKGRPSLKELCATVPKDFREEELSWGSAVGGEDE